MTEEHFLELQKFERDFASRGYKLIGGIDEAGRGPLAGPVAAGCVIVKAEGPFAHADDSKKITEKKRETLLDEVKETALAWGLGLASPAEIDELNILNATYLAMRRAYQDAIQRLDAKEDFANQRPELVLVDHVHIPDLPAPQMSITHGDALSVTIAMASIIAKVERDRIMRDYAIKYPEYGFDQHKGYGTKAHYDAIREFGPSEIHRKSFLKTIH